jgi:hypothetical protein
VSLTQDRQTTAASIATTDAPVRSGRQHAWAAVREVLFVAVLFAAYKLGRLAADGHVSEAMSNAQDIWNLERHLHLPSEALLQHLFMKSHTVVKVANCYYAFVHFPATAAMLIWMYVRRQHLYHWCRRVLAAVTAAALALHMIAPLAPPRMLNQITMVDTGALFGPAVYGSPKTDTLANQYAAMPSLHFGWALLVAITLIVATSSRWRWAWLLHPLFTLCVIVATGNHYWLDAVVAAVIVGLVLLVVPKPPLVRQRARVKVPQQLATS